jgi:PAS domain S-box-containing protein
MEQNSARKYFASNSPSQGDVTQDILTLLSRAALQDNHPVEFVHRALETSREALNADAAQLLTLQPDGDSFKIHYQAGLKGESIENVFIPGGNGSQAGFTLIRMAPVLTSDLQQEKRFSLCEWEQQHRFRSALSVPVPGNGGLYGILILYAKQIGHFSQDQIPTLQGIAALLSFSIMRNQSAGLKKREPEREDQHQFLIKKLRQEIREREKTEQELNGREKVLHSLFESAPDATILVDSQGKIVRANQRVEMIFGYKAEELIDQSVELLLPEKFRSQHIHERAHYTKVPYTRPMGSGLELFGQRKDGTEFPVDIMLSPVETQLGLLTLAAIRDATERKLIENELSEVQRRLIDSTEAERLYLAQELHDGPIQDLYGVSFELSSLRDDLETQEATQSLQAATHTIQDVIAILRGICGDLRPPTLAQFGLEKSIRSHVDGLSSMHPGIKFKLDLQADGQLLPERVRLALFRIYQHAISNVIRHAEANNVVISLAIDTENVTLEIKDDGKGFELPARWIELAREDHLGLVGTAERAQAIGAQLTIESSPGAGTCISVSVPRDQERTWLQAKGSPLRAILRRR